MQYVARLPNLPSTRSMLGLVVALVIGAGVATGSYALIDDGNSGTEATKYIVVEQPAQGSADIPGKNEAATAAAVGSGSSSAATIPGKDEAGTAAAIGNSSDDSSSGSLDLRGSKASTSSLAGTSSQTSDDGESSSPTPFGGHR